MKATVLRCVLLMVCSTTSAVAQVGTGAKSQADELAVAALLDNEL
jgi:hypothetical protein